MFALSTIAMGNKVSRKWDFFAVLFYFMRVTEKKEKQKKINSRQEILCWLSIHMSCARAIIFLIVCCSFFQYDCNFQVCTHVPHTFFLFTASLTRWYCLYITFYVFEIDKEKKVRKAWVYVCLWLPKKTVHLNVQWKTVENLTKKMVIDRYLFYEILPFW